MSPVAHSRRRLIERYLIKPSVAEKAPLCLSVNKVCRLQPELILKSSRRLDDDVLESHEQELVITTFWGNEIDDARLPTSLPANPARLRDSPLQASQHRAQVIPSPSLLTKMVGAFHRKSDRGRVRRQ